jgi:hypothetical protein
MHPKVFVKLKKTLKTLSSGQKTQKNQKKPKKTKKTQKNPLGWVFFKKNRVFSNPDFIILIKPGLTWAREPDPRKSLQPEIGLSIFKDKPVLGIRISQIRIQNTAQITPDRTSVVDRRRSRFDFLF